MSDLKCMVKNCTYNESECCCKGDILVGGTHACCCDETCCESFTQNNRDRFTSSTAHPSKTISIDCEATKCMYNQNYKCAASHVDIEGNGASQSRETACATFAEK